jgi:NADH-quinone oxidoreductase subunit J
MSAFLFYFFSALTILAALLVVLNREAVTSAMCMIVALSGVAALFVLLQAYFLAVLQIVVYAGAVMVLFLFIIMLLDTTARRIHVTEMNLVVGVAALIALAGGAIWLAHQYPNVAELPAIQQLPTDQAPLAYATAAKTFGFGLFTRYMLPFQVAGFLLLIAMVGVIVLSKRPPTDGSQPPGGDPQR